MKRGEFDHITDFLHDTHAPVSHQGSFQIIHLCESLISRAFHSIILVHSLFNNKRNNLQCTASTD